MPTTQMIQGFHALHLLGGSTVSHVDLQKAWCTGAEIQRRVVSLVFFTICVLRPNHIIIRLLFYTFVMHQNAA